MNTLEWIVLSTKQENKYGALWIVPRDAKSTNVLSIDKYLYTIILIPT